ncbi:uncharacterized protein PHACADRAFT_202698 [Phanerochaete carnosa HHB-10118-sp]|uniref:CxC2-like cysteine cluster KDZ transposase-associated domain-containing protein n=1 Tax=Phanerochaete carnosa (strain HHB-10118-sp) TaxID=650164 RepID=K5VBP7_PHACS|nr:uncharacterized protein PHACADRAFT_202698 [Phanerochaete carnosa HHB-10118-sp]EKM48533.1 hypothetical protein PHACADRAFT_202698 [Phanerochaete carnosa HHB-10118-sp]
MFVTTATVWLFCCDMQVASREVVVDVLGRMIRAADILSFESAAPADTAAGISQGGNGVDVRTDHQKRILGLRVESATLTERYGALFRRLLHAFEKAYKLDKLRGNQNEIRYFLHGALKTSHKSYGSTCEVDGCPWIGHVKSEEDEGHWHVECDLLSKSVRPASAAGTHGEEQLAELRPSSSSGPQPSPSSELVISSDPPQGLAHAEPHCTTSHDAPPAPAIRNAPDCPNSRSSLSAAKHKPRRHAMRRVGEARSMDELTRPEAAWAEAGRRRSWS